MGVKKNFIGVFKQGVGDPAKGVNCVDVFNDNGVVFYGVIIRQKINCLSPVFCRKFVIKLYSYSENLRNFITSGYTKDDVR